VRPGRRGHDVCRRLPACWRTALADLGEGRHASVVDVTDGRTASAGESQAHGGDTRDNGVYPFTGGGEDLMALSSPRE
jgi:hypothetical protein